MPKKLDTDKTNLERFVSDISIGLNSDQVKERQNQGLVNKTKMVVGKTYFRIFIDNVFSFYNILLFAIAGLIIYGGYYMSLFFLIPIVLNIAICLYEDISARKLMTKMHLVAAPKANVIRDGKEINIPGENIVLDDICHVFSSNQILADSIVVSGNIGVKEDLLTGESKAVYKKEGDIVYSGSYVITGDAYLRVDKVGKDSYIETLHKVASKFKRSKSEILRSLNGIFNVMAIVVVVVLAATFAIYGGQGRFQTEQMFKAEIPSISGSMVSLIPAGLYLLTSVALAVAVILLNKKKAHVQDFYSVEMLARADTLCIDKTGTITDGSLAVKDVVALKGYDEEYIKKIAVSIIAATKDKNSTTIAINKLNVQPFDVQPTDALPFMSENKYSAAQFKDKGFAFGALEFLNLDNASDFKNKAEEYSKFGYRVITVCEANNGFLDKKINGKTHAIGLIVLEDHIKEDAPKTFKWFLENDVNIKVISGDNMLTTSETARKAGIPDTDKCISMENVSLEEAYRIANDYTVFARVTPEQKERIIAGLQSKGKTVAMTGDGINDILALKKADCSIAMASGAEATKNVSHIVLMNSDFSSLPEVVAEGRRVINNLQRTGSLFLTKTIFGLFFSVLFLLITLCTNDKNISYPFSTNNMYIWELLGIGLTSFFISLEKNSELINGHFLKNILRKAIPAGLMMIIAPGVIFLLYLLQLNGVYVGIPSFEVARSMAVIVISVLGMMVLFNVCVPFSKFRAIVFGGALGITVIGLVLFGLASNISGTQNALLQISFQLLSGANYLVIGLVIIISCACFLFYNYLVKVLKEHKNEDRA